MRSGQIPRSCTKTAAPSTFITWKSDARSWKPSGRLPRIRRNKLIFAGEKKVASHSPGGMLLSKVDTAHKRFLTWNSALCWGLDVVNLAGPRNPHTVATEPRATAIVASFMEGREKTSNVWVPTLNFQENNHGGPIESPPRTFATPTRNRGGGTGGTGGTGVGVGGVECLSCFVCVWTSFALARVNPRLRCFARNQQQLKKPRATWLGEPVSLAMCES